MPEDALARAAPHDPPASSATLSHWFGVVALLLVGSATFAGVMEWEHYRRLLQWKELGASGWDRLAIFWLLSAKSAWMLAPLGAVSTLLAARGRRRAAWLVAAAGSTLVFGLFAIDLQVHRITGNHLASYLRYLGDPDPWQWVGGSGRVVLDVGGITALVAVSVLALGYVCDLAGRRIVRNRRFRGRLGWLVSASALGFFLLGATPASSLVGNRAILGRLSATLPVHVPLFAEQSEGPSALDPFRIEFQRHVDSFFGGIRDTGFIVRPLDNRRIAPRGKAPNVVIVLLESFRFDSIAPEHMPRLASWARRGLRLDRHYATSNASHLGLFALLYARSPLLYYPTLDRGISPQACHTLSRSGYRSAFLTSADIRWQRMEDYINTDTFDEVVVDLEDSWPQRDRRTLERARDRLQQHGGGLADHPPQFVVAFLMTTHFPYAYPPGYERHLPVTEGMSLRESTREHRTKLLNRYRNALGYLDDLLSEFLESVDLERTIVVVTGDHGESLFEDGTLAHSSRPSEFQTRVPCSIVGPGIAAGEVRKITTHLDILPTILGLLDGAPARLAGTDGRDVLAGSLPEDRALLVQFHRREMWDVLLVLGEERLKLRVHTDRPAARVIGFCDASGTLDPTVSAAPDEAPRWARAFRHELENLTP